MRRISTGTGLAVTVAAESALLIGGSRLVGPSGLVLVLFATATWALVVFDPRVEQHAALVVLAIGAIFVVGLAVPPSGSHDLWSYVMDGRAVSAHHASPYLHTPSDFPHDPFLARVGRGWRHVKSPYGPLFTGVSAALTRFAGASALRARLAFQGLAGLGVVATLVLIWRATRSPRAVAFVGLHPAVVTAIVNGGHNDGLVGLAVLAGALLAARRRWYSAGFVLGLGILVKASGVLGLLGVAAWTVRRDRKAGAQVVLAAVATTLAGYVPAGMAAVRSLSGAGNGGNTRASPWDLVSTLLHPSNAIMLIGVLILVVVSAFRWRTASQPGTAATATMAAYLVGGAFVLPWYPAWALPAAALERRSFLSVLVAAHAAFLVAIYELEAPAHLTLGGAWGVARQAAIVTGAFALLGTFLATKPRGRRPVPDR